VITRASREIDLGVTERQLTDRLLIWQPLIRQLFVWRLPAYQLFGYLDSAFEYKD
jgi:hypothetical protein